MNKPTISSKNIKDIIEYIEKNKDTWPVVIILSTYFIYQLGKEAGALFYKLFL